MDLSIVWLIAVGLAVLVILILTGKKVQSVPPDSVNDDFESKPKRKPQYSKSGVRQVVSYGDFPTNTRWRSSSDHRSDSRSASSSVRDEDSDRRRRMDELSWYQNPANPLSPFSPLNPANQPSVDFSSHTNGHSESHHDYGSSNWSSSDPGGYSSPDSGGYSSDSGGGGGGGSSGAD